MLKKCDIFPKAKDSELTVRTNAGGILSIASVVFLFMSIAIEIKRYTVVNTTNKMVLNERQLPSVLPIYLDMEVENNCTNLHFDFTNIKRTMNVEANVSKQFTQRGGTCLIRLEMQAPNIPASFHIGIGESYWDKRSEHSHMWHTVPNRNLSHKINVLKFGEGDVSMDGGTSLVFPKPAAYMVTYHMQLFPVMKGGAVGYRAVASIAKTNLEKIRTRGIPAVIFQWTFAPIGIDSAQVREPVINLVCHLLAVAGCFFVVVRFIDSFVFKLKMLL